MGNAFVPAAYPTPCAVPANIYKRSNVITVNGLSLNDVNTAYSRKLSNHRYAVALFAAAYNFCKVHSTLGCSPAVGLKLATENWTIERLIEEATK